MFSINIIASIHIYGKDIANFMLSKWCPLIIYLFFNPRSNKLYIKFMSNLFDIPSHTLKQEQPEKLDNLSTSKYGKAAFV